MNLKLFLALTAMSFLWVGSQIPLYLYGAVLPLIYSDIGGADGTVSTTFWTNAIRNTAADHDAYLRSTFGWLSVT
jgi:hypothetical protein